MPPIPVLSALADPIRSRIVEMLTQGPQPVHQLASAFDVSRPAISRHLRVLKEAALIGETKVGRENLYALDVATLAPLHNWLAEIDPPAPVAPAEIVVPEPQPEVVVAPAKPPAKVAKTPSVNQMGFDF